MHFLPLVGLFAFASPVLAQDLGTAMLLGMGKSILSDSEKMLNDAPDMLDEMLRSAEQGHTFDTPEACLGALQAAVNAGVVAANVLPFSTVHIFEDRRGPVGRFRMLVNGQKVHLEAFCNDEQMSATMLPWGSGSTAPVAVSQSSFDAVAGLLVLLQAQGAFESDDKTPPAAASSSTPPGAESFSGAPARSDPVNDALRDALSHTPGPPMTSGERDALRVNVQQCWNVGALTSEALRTSITVGFSISRDGRPVPDSIRMIDYDGGDENAAADAFNSAHRAIVRCGANGFNLPVEKYEQWRDVEMTFNAENMRIR